MTSKCERLPWSKNRTEAVLNTHIFVLSDTFKNTVNMNEFTAVDFLEWDEIEH